MSRSATYDKAPGHIISHNL